MATMDRVHTALADVMAHAIRGLVKKQGKWWHREWKTTSSDEEMEEDGSNEGSTEDNSEALEAKQDQEIPKGWVGMLHNIQRGII